MPFRPRKAYCTRHTFIAWSLSEGANLKGLGEYCGTSVAMIEKSYGRFITGDFLAPLRAAIERDEESKAPLKARAKAESKIPRQERKV